MIRFKPLPKNIHEKIDSLTGLLMKDRILYLPTFLAAYQEVGPLFEWYWPGSLYG